MKSNVCEMDKLGKMLTAKEVIADLRITKDVFYRLPHDERPPMILVGKSQRYPERLYWRWKEQRAAQNGVSI